MSAREVFRDRLLEQEEQVEDEWALLKRAVKLSPAGGQPTETTDETTKALADEVREGLTLDEGLGLIFKGWRKEKG